MVIKYNVISVLAIVAAVMCAAADQVRANPILNINTEEHAIYDIFEGSGASIGYSTTMKPVYTYMSALLAHHYEKIKLRLSVEDGAGYYLKPLNSLGFKYFYTQDDNFFFEGGSGLTLRKGSNFFLFEDGYLSLGKYFVVYYQFKQIFSNEEKTFDLNRVYAKLHFWKLSIEGGVDNVNLGPGEFGLLVAHNVHPYPLLLIRTEEPIMMFGKWDFLVFNGWLMEKRDDHDNPMLLAYRVTYKPFDYIEIGTTRSVLHGGKGRRKPQFTEYFDLLTGTRGLSSKTRFGADALGAYDISIYLPFHLLTDLIEVTKIYFETAGSEVLEPWAHENNRAFQYGLFFSIKNNFIRFEYVDTAPRFYTQYNYAAKDYTYKGLPLGSPYGSDMKSFLVKHRFFILDFLSLEYRFGAQFHPSVDKNNINRYYLSLCADICAWRFIISGYFRYDWIKNYDADPLPTKFSLTGKNRNLFTAGASLTWKL